MTEPDSTGVSGGSTPTTPPSPTPPSSTPPSSSSTVLATWPNEQLIIPSHGMTIDEHGTSVPAAVIEDHLEDVALEPFLVRHADLGDPVAGEAGECGAAAGDEEIGRHADPQSRMVPAVCAVTVVGRVSVRPAGSSAG